MSLTAEGYRERKWGYLPTLRQALEDKKIPSHYFGLTTISDNMFESINRLMEISVLVVEYKQHIKEVAQSLGHEDMRTDLRQLEKDLEQASYFLKRQAEEVKTLYGTL